MRGCRCLFALTALAQLAGGADPAGRTRYRIETFAGSDRMGDGGPALAAQIGGIQGVAVDRTGNIYLSDTDFHRVRRVSPAGVISTVAGNGAAGFSGDGQKAVAAQLNFPYGLAVDAGGSLYIADLGNHRVRRVSPDGIISTVAGTGRKAAGGEGGPAAETPLLAPRNLAFDGAGNLYISEFEGHRVRRVSPAGIIVTVAGTGVAGFGGDGRDARAAQLSAPAGLAVDRAGALLICDSQNQRVRKLAGGFMTTALGGAPGTSILTPTVVAADGSGTIYVGDRTASVRQYTAAGVWSEAAGTGEPGYAGDHGPARGARLTAVRDLAVDALGNLWIADGVRIRKVNAQGVISTVAGDGFQRFVGDGGPAALATLLWPSGLALDASGTLWFADTGTERVRGVAASGTVATAAGNGTAGYDGNQLLAAATPLNAPAGVGLDALGALLIADTGNHRIRRVSREGQIRNVAGTGEAATSPDWVTPARAPLRAPRGVCADRAGVIYAVDTSNHRVLRVPEGGLVSTAAGNGSPGDGGDGGRAELAQLNQPSACWVDAAGNLLIADTLNHRIRRVDSLGVITTVAGTGTAGFSGDGGPAASARLNAPRGVSEDAEGGLLIADSGNHRVRRADSDGVIRTLAGEDAAGFSGDGGPAASARLNAPSSVLADRAGAIYIADTLNNRIRRLVLEEIPPEPVELPPEITVSSAAGGRPGPVAPGEVLLIAGTGLGPETGVKSELDAVGLAPSLLAGVEVRFDGFPAPLLYAQASQVLAQVPYAVAGQPETLVEVRYRTAVRGYRAVPVAEAAPAVFPGLQNQDGTRNSVAIPAARGSVVTLYATGEGMTDGLNLSGLPAAEPLARPRLPVSVRIAGVQSEILYAGAAPGQVGVLQVDVRVPAGFVAAGEATLELSVGSFAAPAAAIWLK